MRITICGSIAFIDEMAAVKKRLIQLGHEAKIPTPMLADEKGNKISAKVHYKRKKQLDEKDQFIWDTVNVAMRDHFEKIEWAEAILVCNYDKNGVPNYIGPNTLIEMGLALFLNKKIFLLNPIPDVAWKEEVLGMKPKLINADLSRL